MGAAAVELADMEAELSSSSPAESNESSNMGSDNPRNARLAATDFRVVNDAPWETAPWVSYRQELRDIPESTGFPHEVVWPTEPTA